MKFKDIPQFTRDGNYQIDCSIRGFNDEIARYVERGLILNPDFQRGHVWTEDQQVKFMEYVFRGGKCAPIRLNQAGWMNDFRGEFVCVDGLQRITAILKFLYDELKVFGSKYSEYKDKLRPLVTVKLHVNDLETRAEVLQWYLELNGGGTPHSKDELARVAGLLKKEIER
jgi:uncharacterized protein with ParB-like and HNH nuclease domain